jgi:CrcB protein
MRHLTSLVLAFATVGWSSLAAPAGESSLVLDVWPPSRYLRPFLGTGVLGGFTTFSTYMLETRNLLISGHAAVAGAYLFGSLVAGLAAVWLGIAGTRLATRLVRRR